MFFVLQHKIWQDLSVNCRESRKKQKTGEWCKPKHYIMSNQQPSP